MRRRIRDGTVTLTNIKTVIDRKGRAMRASGRLVHCGVCAAAGRARSAVRRIVRMDKPLGFMVDCAGKRRRGKQTRS